MYLTSDGLKKMAAQCVASLVNEGVPLNDSITKIALDTEMNSDQVKRMVEASNQMAYLSELEKADDRTFEFEVAKYPEILDKMTHGTMDKVASFTDPMDIISSTYAPIEKVAQDKEATLEKWGKGDKIKALTKLAEAHRRELEELKSSEHDNLVKLAQYRAIICRDGDALLKMAKFENGREMSKLVFGHDKVASEVRQIWSDKDMADVTSLSNMLTMCKQASEYRKELQSKLEKADSIIKQAFVAPMAAAASKVIPGLNKVPQSQKLKKAYGTFEAVDSTNEVRKGTTKKYDAWSSLRG